MTAPVDNLTHEEFCQPQPQPGLDAPRLEAYPAPTYQADGMPGGRTVRCVRCLECGVISYDGVQRA